MCQAEATVNTATPEFLQGIGIPWAAAGSVILLGLAVGLLWFLVARRARPSITAKANLLPPLERKALALIEQAVAEEYRVFPQIPMTQIVDMQEQSNGATRRFSATLTGHSADFVLCTPHNLVIVAIIALRSPANKTLRQVCRMSGLALISFRPDEFDSVESIRKKLFASISTPNAPEIGHLDANLPVTPQRPEPTLPPKSPTTSHSAGTDRTS